jgi:hypothetical protein
MAGAVVEHISDPVFAIGTWTKVAKEAVLIPWTTVAETDALLMEPMTGLTDPNYAFAWWQLSKGLYRRVFDNLGFDVEFVQANARFNTGEFGPADAVRPSIVARRRV